MCAVIFAACRLLSACKVTGLSESIFICLAAGTPDAQVACYAPAANKGEFGAAGYEQQWLVSGKLIFITAAG
jgi:hypothetical protein